MVQDPSSRIITGTCAGEVGSSTEPSGSEPDGGVTAVGAVDEVSSHPVVPCGSASGIAGAAGDAQLVGGRVAACELLRWDGDGVAVDDGPGTNPEQDSLPGPAPYQLQE